MLHIWQSKSNGTFGAHPIGEFLNLQINESGFRAVQLGLQNIPVVLIAAKKTPSKEESFSTNALYITACLGSLTWLISLLIFILLST